MMDMKRKIVLYDLLHEYLHELESVSEQYKYPDGREEYATAILIAEHIKTIKQIRDVMSFDLALPETDPDYELFTSGGYEVEIVPALPFH